MNSEQISIIILSFSQFLRKNCIKNKKLGRFIRIKRLKTVSFTEKQVFWTVIQGVEYPKNVSMTGGQNFCKDKENPEAFASGLFDVFS